MKSYYSSLKCTHNKRCRYTTGFQCEEEGCRRFIQRGTLEYFICEESSSIWMALHNRGVKFHRGESNVDISDELKEFKDKLFNNEYLRNLTESEAEEFMNKTYELLNTKEIKRDEACKTLR